MALLPLLDDLLDEENSGEDSNAESSNNKKKSSAAGKITNGILTRYAKRWKGNDM